MADNMGTVTGIYQAFGRGDVAWIVDQLDDDVVWDEGLRSEGIAYLTPRRGKQEVMEFFGHLMANLELTHFEPGRVCDGGDVVMVPVTVAGRIIGGGEVPRNHEAHEWHFGADGKVTEFRHLLDVGLHERAAAERSARHVGRTLHTAGVEIEVLQAGAAFEVFRVSGTMDAGPPLHAHPWIESYLGLAGEVEVRIEGTCITIVPGTCTRVPADTLHTFRIVSAEASFVLMSSGARASAFFDDLDASLPPGPLDVVSLPETIEVVERHGVSVPMPA